MIRQLLQFCSLVAAAVRSHTFTNVLRCSSNEESCEDLLFLYSCTCMWFSKTHLSIIMVTYSKVPHIEQNCIHSIRRYRTYRTSVREYILFDHTILLLPFRLSKGHRFDYNDKCAVEVVTSDFLIEYGHSNIAALSWIQLLSHAALNPCRIPNKEMSTKNRISEAF